MLSFVPDPGVCLCVQFKYSMRGWVVLILVGFILTFRLAAIAALKLLNFQKR